MLTLNYSYLDWLIIKLRPIRKQTLSQHGLNSDYIKSEILMDTKKFVSLIQFLNYAQQLDFDLSFFDDCSFENCNFDTTLFREASFLNCNFKNCSLKNCNFIKAEFEEIKFDNCSFEKAVIKVKELTNSILGKLRKISFTERSKLTILYFCRISLNLQAIIVIFYKKTKKEVFFEIF